MKRLLCLATLLLDSLVVAAPDRPQSGVAAWATAVSKQQNTGRAIVFRYAKSFRSEFRRSEFPDRVILVWKYRSESGMPSEPDRAAMDRMEDLLRPLIDGSGLSVLALSSTGENLREWIFYSKSEEKFLTALNEALKGVPPFPIEIHAAPDPQWATYERFHKGVQE